MLPVRCDKGRRAIHSPVGQSRSEPCGLPGKEGFGWGKPAVSPSTLERPRLRLRGRSPFEATPSRGGEPENRGSAAQPRSACARLRIRRWRPRIRPGVRSVRCGPDYRSHVQKSQVAWSSDFGYRPLDSKPVTSPSGGSASGRYTAYLRRANDRDRHDYPCRRRSPRRARAVASGRRRADSDGPRRRTVLEGVHQPDRAREDAPDRRHGRLARRAAPRRSGVPYCRRLDGGADEARGSPRSCRGPLGSALLRGGDRRVPRRPSRARGDERAGAPAPRARG